MNIVALYGLSSTLTMVVSRIPSENTNTVKVFDCTRSDFKR
uniref:Uncharacterized protein n=1 Tax=Romanomermis culicivorax TaxID=13658 RepID=A0A915L325_ROMCU